MEEVNKNIAIIPVINSVSILNINDPLQDRINEVLNSLTRSKIELAFLLKEVHEGRKWKNWGFRTFSSYIESLSHHSHSTYFKYVKVARIIAKSGYDPKGLRDIGFNKLERIFSLSPELQKHIPNLIEIAKINSLKVLESNIDIIEKKTHIEKDNKIIFIKFNETLDALWTVAENKTRRIIGASRDVHIPKKVILEACLAEFVQGEDGTL